MTQGRDLNLDVLRVQGYRFFCNKLWNAAKFAMMYFPQDTTYESWKADIPADLSLVDRWMLSRIAHAVSALDQSFKNYDFPAATTSCYNLWLYELCDVYLEYLKPVFSQGTESEKANARRTLFTALEFGLTLLSPFMPYITEELFQRLPRKGEVYPSICVAAYPTEADAPWRDETLESDIGTVLKVVHLIRSTRAEYTLANKQTTVCHLITSGDLDAARIRGLFAKLQSLANSELSEATPTAGCAILTVSDKLEIHLVLKGLIDPEKEITKLEKKKQSLQETINNLNKSMSVPDYSTKVPSEVQKSNTEKLNQSQGEIAKIEAAVGRLKLM